MSAALVLSRLPGITPRRLADWRESGRPLEDVLAARGDGLWTPDVVREARDRAKRESDFAAANAITILALDDPAYPELLARIPDPPLAIRIRSRSREGNRLAISRPVAIVGARRADTYGRSVAELFARAIARAESTVISGLASGIDAASHRAALGEPGGTVAVLGTGVDIIYPRDNAGLAAAILADGGALVSELPIGAGPQKSHFPLRNRIIAGLSLGTLVVQAGVNSGSLITARLALDYDRAVWAVPGRVGDPLSAGAHRLLRDGASIATAPDDILADLSPLGFSGPTPPAAARVTSRRTKSSQAAVTPRDPLLLAIGSSGATVDELAVALHRSRSELLAELLKRELSKQVVAEPGGIYRLTFR